MSSAIQVRINPLWRGVKDIPWLALLIYLNKPIVEHPLYHYVFTYVRYPLVCYIRNSSCTFFFSKDPTICHRICLYLGMVGIFFEVTFMAFIDVSRAQSYVLRGPTKSHILVEVVGGPSIVNMASQKFHGLLEQMIAGGMTHA